MAELGYYEPPFGEIIGTGNEQSESDPVARAALQEATTQAMIRRAGEPGYVPATYSGPNAPEWASQIGGPSNLPIVGWTCQNSTGTPFREYDTTHIGFIPDWTGDSNPAAAGPYDANPVVAVGPVNNLNRAPIGEFDGWEANVPPNPNRPPNDVSGTIDLEY